LQQPPVQHGLPGKQHSLFGLQHEAAFLAVAELLFAYTTVPATIIMVTTPKTIFFIGFVFTVEMDTENSQR
jgi:hypothetical protein